MCEEEEEENVVTEIKLDNRFISSWITMLTEALGQVHAGENIWVMNPSIDSDGDMESLATVSAVLGIWQWNLIEMEHEHKGVLGDITTVQKVMVVVMHDDSTKGQLKFSDQALDFEIQDDFTPKLVSI